MIEILNKEKCCGCHACYNICPKNAIIMQEDNEGFKYPVIDKKKCIDCGLCEKVCPILNKKKIDNNPKAYAAINLNEDIRKESSSGGIFTLTAEEIINRNGVVFGASFDNQFNVIHTYIDNKESLKKFRGSKYVQSSIGDMYKKAKELLDNDRYVLFTGTPCQIQGLKSYLLKEYDKLYTQDIICHGVPSPKVWSKYIKYREQKSNEKVQKIEFRNKDNSWKSYDLKFYFANKVYKNNQSQDDYMKAFLRNTSLRPSCYNCSFKGKNRISDITLADFWGIQNVLPELDDDKGTSLVFINSSKGQELFDGILDKIKYQEVDFNDAIKYNPSMTISSNKDENRKKFFENLDKLEFDELVKKYTYQPSFVKKCSNKLKKIIKKAIKRK